MPETKGGFPVFAVLAAAAARGTQEIGDKAYRRDGTKANRNPGR